MHWDKGYKIGEGDFVSFDGGSLIFTLDTIQFIIGVIRKHLLKKSLKNIMNLLSHQLMVKTLGLI